MTNVKIFFLIIGLLILGVISTILVRSGSEESTGPGKYDEFVTCLKDKGATFYGAFWCPHCQAQTKICIDKKITGYPTWEFADGTRLDGEISLAQLVEKTACELPK